MSPNLWILLARRGVEITLAVLRSTAMAAAYQGLPLDREVWAERVFTVLREQFRRAGMGSIRRTEKELRIADGSFFKWRQRGRLDVGMLHRALEALGIEPASFWLEFCGTDFDPVLLARRPTGPLEDPVVRRAVARWEARSPGPSTHLGDEELRRLDGLRDRDPKQGVRETKKALLRAEKRQIPRLLAIYGSARRVEARLDFALEALRHALQLAERGGEGRAFRADILQRLGVALAFTGDHSLGLLFAKEATHQYMLAGDPCGEGRSLVDQGTRYFHLRQLDEAIAAYEAALRLLPEDEGSNRFGAHHSLAVARHRQGSLGEALESVQRAEELVPKVGPRLSALLLATKAKIVTAQGDHAEAERCYAEVLEIYRPLSPIDAALASVDLVRSRLRGGRVGPALETIKEMSTFLEPLKHNKVASQAILRLVRMALAGEEITLQMLDRVAREIEKGRAQRGRRARGRA